MFKVIFKGKAERAITECVYRCPVCDQEYGCFVDPINRRITSRIYHHYCERCDEELPSLVGVLFFIDARSRFHKRKNPPECGKIYVPGA